MKGVTNILDTTIGNPADLTTTDKTIIGAINEINAKVVTDESVSVNYTTTQTWSQIIAALKAASDATKITHKSRINIGDGLGNRVFDIIRKSDDNSVVLYGVALFSGSEIVMNQLSYTDASLFSATCAATFSRTDEGSSNPSANDTITLYY